MSEVYWTAYHYQPPRLTRKAGENLRTGAAFLTCFSIGVAALGGATWLIRRRWQQIVIPLGAFSQFAPLSRLVSGRSQLSFSLQPAQNFFFRGAKYATGVTISTWALALAALARPRGAKIREVKIPRSSQKASERLRISAHPDKSSLRNVQISCMGSLFSQRATCPGRVGHALKRITEKTLKDN
jgi:hypothetical protein